MIYYYNVYAQYAIQFLNRSRKAHHNLPEKMSTKLVSAVLPNFSGRLCSSCFIVLDCFPRINKIIQNTDGYSDIAAKAYVVYYTFDSVWCVYTNTTLYYGARGTRDAAKGRLRMAAVQTE